MARTHQRTSSQDSNNSPADFVQNMYAVGVFDASGAKMSDSKLREKNKRQGMCEQCAKVKTHNRGTFSSQPITVVSQVYHGYCLNCHSIEDVVAYPKVIKAEQKKGGTRPDWVKDLLLKKGVQHERSRLNWKKPVSKVKIALAISKPASHKAVRKTDHRSESDHESEEGSVNRRQNFRKQDSDVSSVSIKSATNELDEGSVNKRQQFRKQESDVSSDSTRFRSETTTVATTLRRRITECDEETDDVVPRIIRHDSHRRNSLNQRRDSLSRQESQKSYKTDSSQKSINTFASEKSDGSVPQSNDGGSLPNLPEILIQIKSGRENDKIAMSRAIQSSISVFSYQTSVNENEIEDNLTDFLVAVLEATQRHSDDLKITILAFEALMAMTTYKPFEGGDVMPSPEACSLVAILPGGIDHIVCSMGKHVASLDLQMNGLNLLRNIVQSTEEAKPQIVEADTDQGINRIIQTMFEHSGSAKIQEHGCVLLWSLSYDDAETQIRIDEAFGVGAIISGMNAHSSYVPLQEQALGALHTLALDIETRENILNNGGTTCIVNVMRTHPYKDTIQEKALTALVALVLNTNPQILDVSLPGNDVAEVTIDAMKNHPKSVGILETSCHMLYLLTKHDENVVEALKKNKNSTIMALRHAASIVVDMSHMAEKLIELIRS